MHQLRLVWQLHRDALQLLRSRLRALRERGPWVSLIIGLLFLPALAVPFFWALGLRELEYLAPLAIYLVAQIAVVLRHPFNPRKAVVHPLPVWYFWAVQGLCAAGAMVLSWESYWRRPTPDPLERLLEYQYQLAGLLIFLVALTLITTALPPLLAHLGALAERLGLFRRFRSASNLYLLVLGFWVTGFGVTGANLRFFGIFVLAPGIPAILLHRKLWRRDSGVLLAVLPQIGVWALLAIILLSEWQITSSYYFYYRADLVSSFLYFIFAAACATALYWLVLSLRVSPVEATDRLSVADEALSVQTDPSHYVDTSSHGAKLLNFIRRSDGGVLGLTGVRGAGKSALIAHLINRLQSQKQHFVLSMTAPVRHDPGLGFLSAVCRAVCRRVLDDGLRALYGKKTEEGRALSEILKRARNLGMAAALLLLACLAFIELMNPGQEATIVAPRAAQDFCAELKRAEITTTDDLLKQVNYVLTEGGEKFGRGIRSFHYRLVPNPKDGGSGFIIAAELPQIIIPRSARSTRMMYARTVVWSSVNATKLFDWVNGDSPNNLACRQDSLVSYAILSLRQFFRSSAGTLPIQQPQGGVKDTFEFAHPDWLSFLLIERIANASDSPLTFEQLLAFRSLLVTYRNSFEGRTVPVAASLSARGGESETPLVRAGLALVKPAWFVVPLILILLAGGPIWQTLSSLARAVANWRFVALYREATQFLELLNYSESLEAKGSLSWKALSLERSRSLAARDLTLPGLTARYIEFVQSVRRHYNGKLIIAIDELDKVHDPEMAKAILTEIKGALFTKGCYYLISISEDARRAFRQRLSSGRDIFESTFDDVIEVPQMAVEAASSMIERRLETSPEAARIPASCHFVLALAGGGIPREIVRHLRALSLAHESDASRLQPGPVATEIFRFEVRDWEAGLAEAGISGEDTIKLRAEAKEILAILRDADFGRPACHRVWGHLERCLRLIDPAKLRQSVILFPGMTADQDTSEAPRYQAILDDIQSCLRLMILTTVCEMAWREGETWKEHETALLAAYRALADKPALAETLLGEIRAALGGSACEGETKGEVSETAATAPG